MTLDRYKAVVFDCDDTIIATARRRWDALIETAGQFDCVLDEKAIRSAWGLPFDRLIASIVPSLEFRTFVEAYKVIMKARPPEASDGARALLNSLAHAGHVLTIVTSGSRDLIIQDLVELDLMRYFSGLFGYEDTEFHKPDPRVLTPALTLLRDAVSGPSEIVYIGDSVRDYSVAVGNGIDFFAVLSGLETRDDFVRAGVLPERIVDSLHELAQDRNKG